MKVLVGCEFSQVVTKAFRDKGHAAYSCDILDCEIEPKWHYKCDIIQLLNESWDLGIFFPPCTHLAVSGARWFKDKQQEQREAVDFFMTLANAPIERICIENPIGIMSSRWRKPDQIIQPWQFGHGEVKATCLWLKNLKLLEPTDIVEGRYPRIWKMGPSKNRSKERSRTYQGVANAMADQWQY